MHSKTDGINTGQLIGLCFVSLLSPVFRLLPKEATALAGSASWLSCAVAFVPLTPLMLIMLRAQKNLKPGEGLATVFTRSLGKPLGRALLTVYALWLLFYAGFLLLSGAERFICSVYPNSSPVIFVAVMLVLCMAAALGRFEALARSAMVMRILLAATLIFVFAFALPDVSLDDLLPLTPSDAVPVMRGAIPVADAVSILSYVAFLTCYNAPGALKKGAFLLLQSVILLIALLLCVTTVGAFGAEMTRELIFPFFVMVRGVSIFGGFQRIEALVIAMWVFTDFVLISVLLRVAETCLRAVVGLPEKRAEPSGPEKAGRAPRWREGRWLVWLCGALTAGSVLALPNSGFDMEIWSTRLIPIINMAFVFGGLPLVFLVGAIRRRL